MVSLSFDKRLHITVAIRVNVLIFHNLKNYKRKLSEYGSCCFMWLPHFYSTGNRELEKMRDEITNEGEEWARGSKVTDGGKREDEETTID